MKTLLVSLAIAVAVVTVPGVATADLLTDSVCLTYEGNQLPCVESRSGAFISGGGQANAQVCVYANWYQAPVGVNECPVQRTFVNLPAGTGFNIGNKACYLYLHEGGGPWGGYVVYCLPRLFNWPVVGTVDVPNVVGDPIALLNSVS